MSAPALHVGGTRIQPTSGASNLGVFFDSHLDLKQHISNVCRSYYFQLKQLRAVRRSLPPGVLWILLHALVSCRLDYCNSLMAGLTLCDIQRLQSVQTLLRVISSSTACPNEAALSQYFETTHQCRSSRSTGTTLPCLDTPSRSELTSTSVSCHSRR